jgi:hypothetical protein
LSRSEQPPAYTGRLHVLLVIHRVPMRVVREAEDPLLGLVVVFRLLKICEGAVRSATARLYLLLLGLMGDVVCCVI